jgi:hypothetical protein
VQNLFYIDTKASTSIRFDTTVPFSLCGILFWTRIEALRGSVRDQSGDAQALRGWDDNRGLVRIGFVRRIHFDVRNFVLDENRGLARISKRSEC